MTSPGEFTIRGNTYQTVKYNADDANYGVYEFIIYGFHKIYERFKNSIKTIINLAPDGKYSIGTGFLIEYNGNKCMVTIKHCIEVAGTIMIFDNANNIVLPSKIYFPKKSDFYGDPGLDFQNLDLCILTFPEAFYEGHLLSLGSPQILDDILVLGYPPTGLFDSSADLNNALIISEKATIAHQYLKGTKGQNAGSGKLPSTALDYFLVSARVKGGNSGGPVINGQGKVVGMISQVPLDESSSASDKIDSMGFGFACPSESIIRFLSSIFQLTKEIRFIESEPRVVGQGFHL